MKPVGFEFRPGSHFQAGAERNPKAVGEHLAVLREHNGGELTPAAVVDDAKNRNSPLHSFFQWDDGAAAEQYRLSQARSLIRAVVAIYPTDDSKTPQTVRIAAYWHIEGLGEAHYRDTVRALSEAETRKIVLDRALRELNGWRHRYSELTELGLIFQAVDGVQASQRPKERAH